MFVVAFGLEPGEPETHRSALPIGAPKEMLMPACAYGTANELPSMAIGASGRPVLNVPRSATNDPDPQLASLDERRRRRQAVDRGRRQRMALDQVVVRLKSKLRSD